MPEAARLAAAARPAIRLVPAAGEIAIGESRLGGPADVPPDFVWPRRADVPLALVAQLDLRAIASDRLPDDGWLLFFFDNVEQPWGFDPADRDGFTVRWVQGSRTNLVRTLPDDLPEECDLGGARVTTRSTVDLPAAMDEKVESVWDDEQGAEVLAERYEELAAEIAGYRQEKEGYHHLFGHPQILQDQMRSQCHMVSAGLYLGGPKDYETPEAKRMLAERHDHWNLLLQVDSSYSPAPLPYRFMWGDLGRLYWWMRDEDLRTRAFERAWCILQSC